MPNIDLPEGDGGQIAEIVALAACWGKWLGLGGSTRGWGWG